MSKRTERKARKELKKVLTKEVTTIFITENIPFYSSAVTTLLQTILPPHVQISNTPNRALSIRPSSMQHEADLLLHALATNTPERLQQTSVPLFATLTDQQLARFTKERPPTHHPLLEGMHAYSDTAAALAKSAAYLRKRI
ncbi:MAG: hypothetical protein V1725_07325 [archaeon]